jgi:hypothetical protein
MLTSPECMHNGNILDAADKSFIESSDQYLIFAVTADNGYWYQHSIHNNNGFNFCSVLPKRLFNQVGGFDSVYADGICYDDNDFVKLIEFNKIPIKCVDNPYALHQYHEQVLVPDWQERCSRNDDLFSDKWIAIQQIKDVYFECDMDHTKILVGDYEEPISSILDQYYKPCQSLMPFVGTTYVCIIVYGIIFKVDISGEKTQLELIDFICKRHKLVLIDAASCQVIMTALSSICRNIENVVIVNPDNEINNMFSSKGYEQMDNSILPFHYNNIVFYVRDGLSI